MALTSGAKGTYDKVDGRNLINNDGLSGRRKHKARTLASWRAPVTILIPLLMGFGIALAHDFMNTYLNGKPVADIVLSQQWVLRFGTALAFLAKLAFTVCVGAAFIQRQWYDFHRHSFRVRDVDTIVGVLGNALNLLDLSLWIRRPVLAFAAIVSWLVPLAAVVTPGTLVVTSVANPNTTLLYVPQPSFDGRTYGESPGDEPTFVLAKNNVLKLAFGAAVSGVPATLASAYVNESYHLDFNGPAVRCASANQSVVDNLTKLFGWSMNNTNGGSIMLYASWVPGGESLLNVSYSDNALSNHAYNTLGYADYDEVYRVFIMTNTNPDWENLYSVPDGNTSEQYVYVNVTECSLWNATYGVDFNFSYPQQTIHVSSLDWLNTSATSYGYYFTEFLSQADQSAAVSYSALMEAFGNLLVGLTEGSHYGINTTTMTSWQMLNIDWNEEESIQRGLESLFQNITLSVLSDTALIKNESEAQLIPVNTTLWPITYVYKPFDLILAYGLGLLTSTICAIVGLHAFWRNNASYQNSFSTFVRTTNDADLRSLVDYSDDGADPIPKVLAKAVISMGTEERPASLQRSVSGTESMRLSRL